MVKYDTTKTKLNARPVMYLLHCMLTCRHTAAGTCFLPYKRCICYISSLFQTTDISRSETSLRVQMTRQDVAGQRSSMQGGDFTAPNLRHAFANFLQDFWHEKNKSTNILCGMCFSCSRKVLNIHEKKRKFSTI